MRRRNDASPMTRSTACSVAAASRTGTVRYETHGGHTMLNQDQRVVERPFVIAQVRPLGSIQAGHALRAPARETKDSLHEPAVNEAIPHRERGAARAMLGGELGILQR